MSDNPASIVAALSLGERQSRIKNIFVEHTRYTEVRQALRSFHFPVEGGYPDWGSVCVIIGPSRTGKSFAVRQYAKDYPAYASEGGMIRPVIVIDVPIDTQRSFLETLASAVGIKPSAKTNMHNLFTDTLTALVQRQTQLLIYDEAQMMFDPANPTLTRFGRTILRKVLNLQTLNIVCVGLQHTYNAMASDPQLVGRGLQYHNVRPYSWESVEEQMLFRLLCDAFDEMLPFNERSNLGSPAVAQRLFYVTQGNIGLLKDYLFSAGALAINDCAERIEQNHFRDAYERRKPLNQTFNPWVHDMSRAPPPPLDASDERGTEISKRTSPRDVFSKKSGGIVEPIYSNR